MTDNNFKKTDKLSADLATSNGDSYGDGDLIGSIMQLATVDGRGLQAFSVKDVTVINNEDGVTGNYDLYLFDEEPSQSTAFLNNSALNLDPVTVGKIVPGTPIPITNHYSAADTAYSSAENVQVGIRLRSGVTTYGALVSREAPTFGSAAALSVVLGILKEE